MSIMTRLSKNIRKTLRAGIMTFLAGLSCACSQDIVNNEAMADAMSFSVTTGNSVELTTKSPSDPEDTTDLLQPLVLRADGLDMPLYLHTYVRDREDSEETIATKSTPVNDAAKFKEVNGTDGFGVTAFFPNGEGTHIPTYSAVKPRSEGSVWSTTPLYYWPPKGKELRFFAFAPATVTEPAEVTVPSSVTNLEVTNTQATFNFKTPSGTNGKDAESQPDLMFATNLCDRAGSKNGTVPMNFSHALSAIKFAIRDVVDGTIENISITGVAGSGKCVYDFSTGGFAWSDYGNAGSSYSQTFGYKVTGVTSTPSSDGSSDVVLNNQMPGKTFMLIPQDIPAEAKIEVVFKRNDGQTFNMSGKINDNKVTKWEPGKEYVYTISTSSSNWIYNFKVIGCKQARNDDEPSKGEFSDAFDSIVVNQTVTEGAYYKVISYRERANNPSKKEFVPWTAEATKGKTSFPDAISDYIGKYWNNDNTEIDPKVWMPDNTWSGDGSYDHTQYNVTFRPQITGTDWEGDWQMRKNPEVESASSPRDLSMVTGVRNTANCYVVNAPGYYKLPLVYGNAITNGSLNSGSYTFTKGNINGVGTALKNFKDYKGKDISGAKISGAKSAILVWQDAYNLVSDVKLEYNGSDGYDYLTFKVNSDELQQGNAVLAIKDGKDDEGTIMWSWHIWIDEHWFYNNTDGKIGSNDVTFDAWDNGYGPYTSAPYNLGWCDPKNVWYLKRTGTMTFTQDKSGNKVTLNVEQREKKIEYWIGNNVYYQFGRKDPIVGFMNSGSVVKYNFGKLEYKIRPQTVSIQESIQHPNVMFVGGTWQHWLPDINVNGILPYYNLWNNANTNFPSSTDLNYEYSGVKTVYDPSPVGYQVPPDGFFKIMVNAHQNVADNKVFGLNDKMDGYPLINGSYETVAGSKGYRKYYVRTKKNGGSTMMLTGTGERSYKPGIFSVTGGNMNPDLVYLWSNQIFWTKGSATTRAGASFALGEMYNSANERLTTSAYKFIGAAAMARPVRPVREFTR